MRSNIASWPHEQTWPRVSHHYAEQIAAAKQRSGERRKAKVDVRADNEHGCDHKRHQCCWQKKNDPVRGAEHNTGHAGTYQKDSHRIPHPCDLSLLTGLDASATIAARLSAAA
jgi:hypothetical protein